MVIIYLALLSPAGSSSSPVGQTKRAALLPQCGNPYLFSLAPNGVYHAFAVTVEPVSSYLTFSPLPVAAGRFIFCGTSQHFIRNVFALRSILPCGVRTFLSSDKGAAITR